LPSINRSFQAEYRRKTLPEKDKRRASLFLTRLLNVGILNSGNGAILSGKGNAMRIVIERTDVEAGMLTLEDDHGKEKRYVCCNRNAPLPDVLDLLKHGERPLDFAKGNRLDRSNLPDRLTLGIQNESGAFVSAQEYQADERGYLIWEKFRDCKLESRPLDARNIKQVLDTVDPQPARPWTVKEIEAEMGKWAHDKEEW
jgi:hypothetical protein